MLTDLDLENLTEEELQAMGADDASICRDDFAEFVKRFWHLVPGAGELIWSWHIQLFCDELAVIAHRVQKGEDKLYDLVLNVSPGTSKSTVWSILFPAWVWTFFPQCRILTASHTDQLALDLANKARTVIKSELYRKYYPEIILRTDQDTKGYYANTFGGDRFTCTVSGKSPIGFHGHILIIDDPIDPKKVLSEVSLRTAREFITTVLPPRKVNKAVTVTCLIMQRLGVGDPTEVMLENSKKEGAAKVRHICLPADLIPLPEGGWDGADVIPQELAVHYREGLMDPSRLSRTALAEARSRGPHYYETQFRQKPYSRFGGMFQPAFFNNRVKAAPRDAVRIRYWDRAATSVDQDGCATAGVLMAKDVEGNYYVEHVVTGHWLPKQRNDRIKAAALRDRSRYGPKNEPKAVIEAERGSTGLESFQNIARLLAGFRVEEDRPSGSKVVRAEPWSDACASGIVYIVDDGTWDVSAYVDEHCAFPLGKLLDQTDASSGAFNLLAKTAPVGELRVLSFDTSAKIKHPRLVVCDREHLPTILAEQRTMLLEFRQPSPVQEETTDLPPHALTALVDSLTLTFADINTADYQEQWNSPVEPYGKPPADLVMTREHGKKIWAWLLKKREPAPEVYFLVDDGTRVAESVAKGIADVLRIPRSTIYFAVAGGDADTVVNGESPAPNGYVYDMTRVARGAVL